MARKELDVKASRELWKSKKADAIAFESQLAKPIKDGIYTLGRFVATEGAIKNSEAVTFHYELEGGLKLYTKHLNGTTVDDFNESYVESNNKHYIIPKNRYSNVLISQMSELTGKKVRISQDDSGYKVKFVPGGYLSEESARDAWEKRRVDKMYKVEFL